ncbi:MAG: FRG domain-containing protein [Anaerolineae bacterium]|nr:FRG domain-containing protein [Anaerolineae bacterium]
MQLSAFELRQCQTASEFLAALRLSSEDWRDQSPGWTRHDVDFQRHWLFRGQRDATWRLLPTSFRHDSGSVSINNTYQDLARVWATVEENDLRLERNELESLDIHYRQRFIRMLASAFLDFSLVREFALLADSLGYHLPDFRRWLVEPRKFLHDYARKHYDDGNASVWTHPIVALARHHGMPIRLLDWTQNPLFAAFFAAMDAVNCKEDVAQEIVVFAIHSTVLNSEFMVVQVPHHENAFLQAQQGVLVFDQKADHWFLEYGVFPCLEDRMQGRFHYEHKLPSRKITLPTTEARELLRLLALEGVSQAHLFPSLDSVAATIKTRISGADSYPFVQALDE